MPVYEKASKYGVFLVILGWFFWIGSNKFPLVGEIAVCDSSLGPVNQFVSSPEDSWPEYIKGDGEKISCGQAGSDNVFCGDFLGSLSDCTIVYRHYEDGKASDLYQEEYKKNIEEVFKSKLD